MKIDFNQPITALDGTPAKADPSSEELVTLGVVAINALLSPLNDPRTNQPENLAATEKVRHAKLAQDIFSAIAPLDLKAEDVALLKERIGRGFAPLTVARAWDLLDPPASKGER